MNDSKRDVAAWTLFIGGELVLEGGDRRIHDVSELPAGDFKIRILDLTGTLVEPPDLARLSALDALRELYLAGPSWNRNADGGKDHSKDLQFLASVKTLQKLTFSYHFLDRTRFHDAGLETIQSLPDLRELS